MRKIKRIAIANRGEVAVRIIRAAEELGLETLLLHSEADIGTRAYRQATHKICIGPAATGESYLNIENNIQGALAGMADAVHPGFGFLSENADFAAAVEKANLIFIGPPPESIRRLGDKIECKEVVKSLGLPLVPGYQGEDQKVTSLVKEAERIGFPVMVKAAAGGGGRGMKILRNVDEAMALIESAQREAQSAFGSPKVFLEKYLDKAKHIEFQIFADASGRVIHLFDRECSVQRRHQKIIEEAPSPSLTPELRLEMGDAAVKIVSKVGYRGAGTVEFMLQDGKFYFLEVNTRLQVEHTVTEEVVGVDLVKAQILTAMKQPVFLNPPDRVQGHSIECRVYAENPYMGGVPSTGKLGTVRWPEGPGRRFEYGFEEGDEITPYYDPMIAKVIVWDEDRRRAIQKMIQVLTQSVVFGVHSNIPYLIEMLSHPEFGNGSMTTRFVETYFSSGLKAKEPSELQKKIFEKAIPTLKMGGSANLMSSGNSWTSPWTSSWRGV